MSNNSNNGIVGLGLLVPAFILTAWIVNIVKLVNCDFDAPYKQEIIHAIGLIPGVSIITCWF
jgi:hypothetical protein